MANDVLIEQKTPIVWANSGDYAGDGGARTHQLDLTSLAAAAARQGAKADTGDVAHSDVADRRAKRFTVTLRIEFDVAPADDKTVDVYMGPSLSETAATANPGGLTGSDAAFTGTAGSSLAESLQQLDHIGSMPCTNDAAPVVQQMSWPYEPSLRYVSPVVVDSADQAFEGDGIEMSVTMTPIVDQIQ